ncbi:hypothetical protein TRIUR3_02215 [Triticum urartu]|uniref:Uncharacterized protein n=1 Tax=Triticum urartu TaxID=4572 RepID=M8AU26_TRIUA|nr:hypothetical protein TRIUR3_02215 [Triticum urartu]
MDQKTIIVCSVVGSLGVLSAILGFSAEGTKLTVSDLIMAIIAFSLLVTGAAWNTTGTRDPSPFGLCYVLKDGIFAGGAVLTLVATALGLTSYVMLRGQPATAAPKEGEQMPAGAAGISMGQPQFQQQPPQGQGYGQAPNPHYAPPPAQGQGYGAHAANQQQQQLPPPPGRGYGQYPPPKGHEQFFFLDIEALSDYYYGTRGYLGGVFYFDSRLGEQFSQPGGATYLRESTGSLSYTDSSLLPLLCTVGEFDRYRHLHSVPGCDHVAFFVA